LVACAIYPLFNTGDLRAVLVVFHRESMSPIMLDVLGSFAHQAGAALENARLLGRLEAHNQRLEQAVADRTVELRRVKERVEAILDNSPDGILLLGPQGTIESANRAFHRICGYDIDEVYKRSLADLCQPAQAHQVQDTLQEVAQQRAARRLEVVARRKDGQTFDADLALAPIVDSDELSGIVCSLRDISALKEVERMKDAFVANVSHELRTPIAGMKLNHQLLATDSENQPVYLDRLGRAIVRLEQLIEDLLRLSRLDQAQTDLALSPVDLNALVGQTVADRHPLTEQRDLDLVFVEKTGIPAVQADVSLIEQALSVLLTNAIHYTPPGGQISVRTLTEHLDGAKWAGFSVYDTGSGIPDDELPHLFERFYRGKVGQDSGVPGTGLGLAIAREIVDRHRGRIEVSNRRDVETGAVFSVWLPAEEM
jgi:PAS domain S-box-containing protein